jgi:hypothetical protein
VSSRTGRRARRTGGVGSACNDPPRTSALTVSLPGTVIFRIVRTPISETEGVTRTAAAVCAAAPTTPYDFRSPSTVSCRTPRLMSRCVAIPRSAGVVAPAATRIAASWNFCSRLPACARSCCTASCSMTGSGCVFTTAPLSDTLSRSVMRCESTGRAAGARVAAETGCEACWSPCRFARCFDSNRWVTYDQSHPGWRHWNHVPWLACSM